MADEREGNTSHDETPATYEVRDKRRVLIADDSEIVAAAGDGDSGERRFPSFVEELQDKLRLAEARTQAIQEKYQQAREALRAEADEIRARLAREYERRAEQARAELIASLLEGIDNLERTIEAAEAAHDAASLLEGVKATHAVLLRRLSESGLAAVPSDGERFDPEIHEAVEVCAAAPGLEDMVLATLQKGYRVGEKLVRPARVKVGRAALPESSKQILLTCKTAPNDT